MESLPTTVAAGRTGGDATADAVGRIPVLEARETSGLTSKLVLAYAEKQGGVEAVDRILRHCGLEGREAELRDESSCFSFDAKIRLFEAAAEVLDDPQV